MPRHNFIAGHEVRHGGFYPDYQLRLLRRARAATTRNVPSMRLCCWMGNPATYSSR